MAPPALGDLVVLDLSTVGPATRASRILADYGLRVVKVGVPPRKAGVQQVPPHYAYSGSRGMQSVRLDLKDPGGKDAFLRLAEKADVVLESYRPGVVKRLGIGYEDVRARNERIVYASTSGYGQEGPHSQWAGHDLDYLGVSGFLDCSNRRADGGPPIPGASIADGAGGGMHAAMAILGALLRRERTGRGEYLDVSVADGMLFLMSLYIDEYLATGKVPGPGHYVLTGRNACYDTYQARDGKWLALGIIEPAFWANLCRELGLEEWIEHQYDDAKQDEIRGALRAAFAQRERAEWIEKLPALDTCVAPAYSVPELVDDPQFQHRGAFIEARHPEHGGFRQLGAVLAGSEATHDGVAVPDLARTHTQELLRSAGLEDAEIDALISGGAAA